MPETSVVRTGQHAPLPQQNEKKEPDEMSFLEHLEALRWHIIRALASIFIVAIGVFLAKDFVFDTVILGPTKESFITYQIICSISETLCFYPSELEIITRDLAEQFLSHIKASIWLGLVVAFPYVFYEIWKFIKPGLYEKEQKAARGVVFVCSLLFLMGVSFGYFVISPFAITFLSKYTVSGSILNTVTLTSMVNNMTMFTLPVGLIFELPIFVYFMAKVGLITSSAMKKYRKHSAVVILILAAIITPPDVITQFLIGLPLYILFEAGIVIAARVEKKREKEENEGS